MASPWCVQRNHRRKVPGAAERSTSSSALTPTYEGGLLNQEAVKVIQEEPGPGRQVDEAAALRGEVGPASEGSDQFTLEGHCLPSASHSAIKGMESPELYPDHRGSQAVAGAGLSGLHDGSIMVASISKSLTYLTIF